MTNLNPYNEEQSGHGDITVANDPAASRYEARLAGELAGSAAYVKRDGGVITFTHTEVDQAYEGKGVGSVLVRAALDDVRVAGGTVDPQCAFVRSWIERHPDYQDLVVP